MKLGSGCDFFHLAANSIQSEINQSSNEVELGVIPNLSRLIDSIVPYIIC